MAYETTLIVKLQFISLEVWDLGITCHLPSAPDETPY